MKTSLPSNLGLLGKRSAQNRCVVAEDYETIVRRIYPSADDIYVFGGDELEIPQYGRVYIVIKPIEGSGLTTQRNPSSRSPWTSSESVLWTS